MAHAAATEISPHAPAQAHGEEVLMAHGSILQTGITNGKIAMWLFLGSEIMFFTGLIGAYIVLRFGQDTWVDPAAVDFPLNVPLTAANTFLLICSSVTLVYGLQQIQAGDNKKGNRGLMWTTIFGALFVAVQAFEYYELYHHGFRPSSDIFSSCFYTMTGFHGIHVAVGVVCIFFVWLKGLAGHYSPKKYATVELTGLYWHFVDLVWIILFAIVYLM